MSRHLSSEEIEHYREMVAAIRNSSTGLSHSHYMLTQDPVLVPFLGLPVEAIGCTSSKRIPIHDAKRDAGLSA